MTDAPTPLPGATLDALALHARSVGLERTLLVAHAAGAGREILHALGRTLGVWGGFEVITLRPLALELALPRLAQEGLTVLDEFQEEALLDEVLDRVLEREEGAPYRELAGAAGFRRGVRDALSALSLAGIGPGGIRRADLRDGEKAAFLASLLREVEGELTGRRMVGMAGVLTRAAEALEGGARLRGEHLLLLPGLSTRGLRGRLLRALLDRGGQLLPGDPVRGVEVPRGLLWREADRDAPLSRVLESREPVPEGGSREVSGLPLFETLEPRVEEDAPAGEGLQGVELDLFSAAGVHEELVEVLRRILASGARWEEVELVTPDPGVYGPALHALASRLEVDVTFAVGLPVARTLPGRGVAAWIRWVGEDFPAGVLHRLLARGDLRAPGAFRKLDPARLGRRLRRLRVGWGRKRYLWAVDAALARMDRARAEGGEAEPAGAEREREELQALRELLRTLLEATPEEIPERMELRPRKVSPGALARSLTTFLGLLDVRSEVDRTALDRLVRILDRAEAELRRPASFRAALGALEDHLDIRVPAPRAEGRAPWVSDGGSLHLSDLEHGGLSGRPLTFLVGLDAGRFPGSPGQDPLLLDGERRRISDALPTSRDRLHDATFRLAALLARLRGRVTLSHPVWDAASAQTLTPSPVILQAFRLLRGEPAAGFQELRRLLGPAAGRVPRRPGTPPVDLEDAWLQALASPEHFYQGRQEVRSGYPRLHRGLAAREAWSPTAPPSAHTGVVTPRPSLDPRRDAVLSPTRLEALGTCPLRYFHGTVLGLRPPDDPEYRPDAWLDNLRRGSLLHRVFERLLRGARDRALSPGEADFHALAHDVLQEEVRRMSAELPPPSRAVRERETEGLAGDVRSFVAHVQEHGDDWLELELSFGLEGGAAVEVALGEGSLSLRGRVDRVDGAALAGGGLTVMDYKTGRAGEIWGRKTGVYRSGRRLQHLVYALAVERITEWPVEAVEYHFPTRRGEGVVVRFRRDQLSEGPRILELLSLGAARGWFVPTDDAGDCRFCDFRPVCRVTETQGGSFQSPAATYGAAHLAAGTREFSVLKALRGLEEDG